MTKNGSVPDVMIAAPPASAASTSPAPMSDDPATKIAVVNVGTREAPRAIVGILADGTPVLYEQKGVA